MPASFCFFGQSTDCRHSARHAADLMEPVAGAVAQSQADLGFTPASLRTVRRRARDNLGRLRHHGKGGESRRRGPLDGALVDLGGWEAVCQESGPDGQPVEDGLSRR